MLDFGHIPKNTGAADVQIFTGNSPVAGNDWVAWHKPRGKTMLDILLIGKGGNGGLGVVGAASTAAGGGGGGSGGQTRLLMPLALLPDILYLSLAGISATTTLASYIATAPKLTAGASAPAVNDTLMYANGGGNGGNGSGATAGAAGAAGAVAVVGSMPLGWAYATALAGQAGIIGGTTGASSTLTLPVTGLLATGGTGGSGIGAAAGFAAGAFAVVGSRFPAHTGGSGGGSTTTPPGNGSGGYQAIPGIGFFYGGTGGGSTYGTGCTGAGLYASKGGNGGYGSGGGGNGGAFTGTTPATANEVGQGGPAICIITCF